MIDTIVLTLTKDLYHITEPDRFTPSARWATGSRSHYSSIKSIQNPTKKELLNGIYKPRLTISCRPTSHKASKGRILDVRFEPMLKIELSLPKLVYGNNFDELQYKDFKQVSEKLAVALETMGVIVSTATLTNAPVSAIHYSKNISLHGGDTPYQYIQKFKEANIKRSLDTNETNYRNEGHSYRWHCNSYEVVFYDKIRDLEQAKKSSKRVVEKDSDIQLKLAKAFEKRNKLEILRMEVRLNKRVKMKQLFGKLGVKTDLTFKKLFKPAIAKKVLLHYVDELESKRSSLLDYEVSSDKGLLTALIFNNPDLSPNKIMQLFGLKKAFEVVTTRELRLMLGQYSERSWYRLMVDARDVKLPVKNNYFGELRRHIEIFKPTKLATF